MRLLSCAIGRTPHTAALLDAGAAYEHDGTVWFRGAGVAATAGLDEATARALLEAYADPTDAPGQQHTLDVAVWRPSVDDAPAWASPVTSMAVPTTTMPAIRSRISGRRPA